MGLGRRDWYIEERCRKEVVFEGPALRRVGGTRKVQREAASTVFLPVGDNTWGTCVGSLARAAPLYVLNDHHEDVVIYRPSARLGGVG